MREKNYLSGNPSPSAMLRFLPPIVVFSVIVGFVGLSWYAYRSNSLPTKDGDVLVVEADKTPVKEKPLDAGGMQFPNQDKTIFDTFSASSQQPPKVERVLPLPEEPVATPSADTSEPAGWINDKQHADASKPEEVITPDKTQTQQDVVAAMKKPMVAEPMPPKETQLADAKSQPADDQTTVYVKMPDNTIAAPAMLPVEEPKPVTKDNAANTAAPALPKEPFSPTKAKPNAATEQMDAIVGSHGKPTSGAIKVQLGAYRSEQEAKDAWKSMEKKHGNLLAGMPPTIIKTDLGDKGIYYRLRAGGFAKPADANALCSKLQAAGQACIIAAAK